MLRFFIPICLILAIMPSRAEPAATPVIPRETKADPAHQTTAAWIWKSVTPGEKEKVFFRREFELPPEVTKASVTVACDDWNRLLVNGRELGMAGEWANSRTYDVLAALNPGGRNVIAVEGRNTGGAAGMALRFRAKLKDGKKLHVVSDANWQCANEAPEGWQNLDFPAAASWPKAVVIAKMGDAPWGQILPPDSAEGGAIEDLTSAYQVVPGFKLERIYRVPADKGSWVAMTVDDKGRLLCSDQYGKIYRVTLPAGEQGASIVEPLAIPLQGAHGLLWHEGVLWVAVNEGSDQSGIWRVTDSNGDREPDKPELVKAFKGRGEHGPHGLVASPDGKSIYVTSGNFTDLAEMDSSLVSKSWAEDQLLPRRPDARGHARDRFAPGGWIARFDTNGKNFQLFASGFRNAYDIAFNDQGDLFTYDSDMEWDLGTPWYRPTRICHVVPGAEFGWRNGSGPWPPYYEDSMAPTLEIGPGSPTGMVSGAGAKFPARFQRAIFAMDWTFATLYAIHLTRRENGEYHAEREEFISGTGLPLTDATIGKDGAMYFLNGGRRTDSALWRVTYTGSESTAPAEPAALSGEIARGVDIDRTLLQSAVAGYSSKETIELLWSQIGSIDRLQRYSARLVLEQIPAESWVSRLDQESDPWRVITTAIAVARVGSKEQSAVVLNALDRLEWAKLDQQQQLNWLRAAGLIFARHGPPDEATRQKVLAKIDASFPAKDDFLNRELCRMLSYLQTPGIVARTLTLMDSAGPSPAPDWLALAKRNDKYGKTVEAMIANLPPAQVIHYVYCLRIVKGPWHGDERKRFFAWLAKLSANSGGESYAGFILDLRKETLATCTPEEREWVEKLPTGAPPNPFANLPPIKGPGREWTIDEVVKLADSGLDGRNKEHGKDMFRASLCAACHRFGNEGGAAGPDLTSLAGRFVVRDLAEAILDPSKVVSDQFAFDLITRQDGTEVTGKIIEEKDEKWIIATSPFDFTQTTEIERNAIKGMKHSPVSPMPPGLINRLNPDELKDLLAYLLGK
ncbi:MAG: heme-binding protein [Verrucomicrobiota bacterium]